MKNISDLKRQLDNLQDQDIDILNPPLPSSAKQKNRAKFLSTCIQYLESEPSEAFVKKEIGRIETRIAEIMRMKINWTTDKRFESKEKAELSYRLHYGVPQLEVQLNTLKFLAE